MTRRYRTAAGIAAFAFLSLVGMAIIREERQSVWKEYQQLYRDTVAARAAHGPQRQSALEYPIEVRQISVASTHVTDRCVSCHVGIEDAQMASSPLPYRSHSGILLAAHTPEKFGCTVCHGGIGQSLDRRESCGAEEPDQLHVPFLPLHAIASSCGRCHLAIFDTASTGMPTLALGKMVLRREGCLGCHRVRGKGGSVGPDLTNEGSKSLRAFDFSHVPGPRTIANWMRHHFMNPAAVSPGSAMPAYALADQEREALIVTVRGLFSPTYPPEYLALPLIQELKGAGALIGGREGFALFCVACHGRDGTGREFTTAPFGVPHLASADFQAVASDEFLMFSILEGRGGRMMASWSPRVSHLRAQELREIAGALRMWRSPVRPVAAVMQADFSRSGGEDVYRRMCATCHGVHGEGDLAKGINNPDFLALASNRFLLETIMKGRANTAMPAWSHLTDRDLRGVLAFLRSMQTKQGPPESAMPVQGNATRGDSLFYNLCSRCHGRYGEGDLGPAILNRDFLAASTDWFLFETIARGREHTPMFGWTQQSRAGKKLVATDINDVIQFMRSAPRPDFLPAGPSPGIGTNGKQLFGELCAECHGETGEGKKAPALQNQEFLGAATNGYLLATITLGRHGTPMPSWGTGSPEHRRLSASERKDLVAFIRSWQTVVIRSEALK